MASILPLTGVNLLIQKHAIYFSMCHKCMEYPKPRLLTSSPDYGYSIKYSIKIRCACGDSDKKAEIDIGRLADSPGTDGMFNELADKMDVLIQAWNESQEKESFNNANTAGLVQ